MCVPLAGAVFEGFGLGFLLSLQSLVNLMHYLFRQDWLV